MFTSMELNQVEGALLDQLDRLAQQERRMTPGTFESECVIDAIRYTGSALTKVQLERHGEDDSDEPLAFDDEGTQVWGIAAHLIPVEPILTPGELTELWGK